MEPFISERLSQDRQSTILLNIVIYDATLVLGELIKDRFATPYSIFSLLLEMIISTGGVMLSRHFSSFDSNNPMQSTSPTFKLLILRRCLVFFGLIPFVTHMGVQNVAYIMDLVVRSWLAIEITYALCRLASPALEPMLEEERPVIRPVT